MKPDSGNYLNRYRQTPAATQTGNGAPPERKESIHEFLAFLYSTVRHDAAIVRLLDRALKERYGDNVPKSVS